MQRCLLCPSQAGSREVFVGLAGPRLCPDRFTFQARGVDPHLIDGRIRAAHQPSAGSDCIQPRRASAGSLVVPQRSDVRVPQERSNRLPSTCLRRNSSVVRHLFGVQFICALSLCCDTKICFGARFKLSFARRVLTSTLFKWCFACRRADTPMPLHESEAIVLHGYPLGEADRLVSFLSRTMGRMRGVAAGARRPKSRFGSTLERLSHVRIWFFERETRELVRISQCELIESFVGAFSDYDSSVGLSLFSEVTQAVLPDREASDANFRLLLLCAQTVKRTGKVEPSLAYFTLWTVKLGGWLPPLDACSRCGRMLQAQSGPPQPAYFSSVSSAIVCANCRKPGMRTIGPPVLAAMRGMLSERLDRLAEGAVPPRAAKELAEIMLDVIEHQIDRKLASRELLESA